MEATKLWLCHLLETALASKHPGSHPHGLLDHGTRQLVKNVAALLFALYSTAYHETRSSDWKDGTDYIAVAGWRDETTDETWL